MLARKLTIFILFIAFSVKAESQYSDSLRNELKHANDTMRVLTLYRLYNHYKTSNNDSSFHFAHQMLKEAQEIKFWKGIKLGYMELAHKYISVGKYNIADSISTQLLNEMIEIKDRQGEGRGYFLLGLSCDYQGKYAQAIDYYVKSLKIMEDIGHMEGVANCYTNIGIVYYFEKMYDKTITNYKKAFEIVRKYNIKKLEENLLNNIATVYYQQDKLDSALVYYKMSYNLIVNHDDQSELGTICGNIGLVFDEKGMVDSAIYYHQVALHKHTEQQNVYGLATTNKDLGKLYNSINAFEKAIEYLEKSIQYSRQINSLQVLESAYGHIHKSYYGLGNLEEAYQYQLKYSKLKDSIISERSAQQILEVETKYQTEVKEKEILKLNEQNAMNELTLLKKEAENSRNIFLFILFGSIVSLGLIFFFIAFRQKKRSNTIIMKQNEELNQINEEIAAQRDEIEAQKDLVDEKNREITASITYAKRIQEAILPSNELLTKHLPESFVLYQPKDVVAGDFYWLEQIDDCLFFAVADCTGHGVPGAMVSVVCNGALNRAVREYGLRKPSDILDKTRELVIDTFKKSQQQVMDGMDICLCVRNDKTGVIEYAGANNPLYLIKNDEIEIVKADRQAIGYSTNPTPFTNIVLDLENVTELFLFSDGFADQFGGTDGKKLGYKNFRAKLIEISKHPMDVQGEQLDAYFKSWRGYEEQVDDVCVIGVKITD